MDAYFIYIIGLLRSQFKDKFFMISVIYNTWIYCVSASCVEWSPAGSLVSWLMRNRTDNNYCNNGGIRGLSSILAMIFKFNDYRSETWVKFFLFVSSDWYQLDYYWLKSPLYNVILDMFFHCISQLSNVKSVTNNNNK